MRYKKFFSVFFAAFWLLSCGSPVPRGVLPPKQMGAVLYDVIRADELVDFKRMSDTAYNHFQRRTALYDTVFQLHKVRREEFQKSFRFYQGRPDLLKEILDDLQKKITDTSENKKQPKSLEKRGALQKVHKAQVL